MSASSEDEVLLEHPTIQARRMGRTPMKSLVKLPGPAILVAVVASPDGRWAAEATGPSKAARAFRESLLQALSTRKAKLTPAKDSPQVIGIAALVSWEYVRGNAFSKDTHLLMSASAYKKGEHHHTSWSIASSPRPS